MNENIVFLLLSHFNVNEYFKKLRKDMKKQNESTEYVHQKNVIMENAFS